jgi:hypothetical protein
MKEGIKQENRNEGKEEVLKKAIKNKEQKEERR